MIKSVGTLMRKSEDGFWKAFLSFYFIFYHVTHRSQTEVVMFVSVSACCLPAPPSRRTIIFFSLGGPGTEMQLSC